MILTFLRDYGEQVTKGFADCSPSLYKWFKTYRLKNARVFWINERWFLERNINVFEPTTKTAAERWLISEFAFSIPQPHEPPEAYLRETRYFGADSYGGTGGPPHGGSGRCGSRGVMQVKGIGMTPLVGVTRDFAHSNGSVTLEEAIRETIYSEIAGYEMPHGAIPVVAILETGTCMPWGEKKALIIRPIFFRASHLQRAPFFRSREPRPLDHLVDASRVIEMAKIASGSPPTRRDHGIRIDAFADFAKHAIEQLAAAIVQRLYFGVPTTANMTLNGEVLDFGTARALPNWFRVISVRGGRAFGFDDLSALINSCKDVEFHLRRNISSKYNFLPKKALSEQWYKSCFQRAIKTEFGKIFNLNNRECSCHTRDFVVNQLMTYFLDQQRTTLNYLSDHAREQSVWIYDSLLAQKYRGDSVEQRTLRAILRSLLCEFSGQPMKVRSCLATAARLLMPRHRVFRESLQRDIYRELVETDACASEPISADKFIQERVFASLRMLRFVSTNWVICGCAGNSYSMSVLAKDMSNGENHLIIFGTRCGDKVAVFGHQISIDKFVAYNREKCQPSVIRLATVTDDGPFEVVIDDCCIVIPKMHSLVPLSFSKIRPPSL